VIRGPWNVESRRFRSQLTEVQSRRTGGEEQHFVMAIRKPEKKSSAIKGRDLSGSGTPSGTSALGDGFLLVHHVKARKNTHNVAGRKGWGKTLPKTPREIQKSDVKEGTDPP